MKNLSSFFQFILGFFLGVALLAGGTAALGYFVFTRLAASPEKPLFAEEKKAPKPVSNKETPKKTNTDSKVSPSASPTVTPTPEAKDDLPSGTYRARVTWPQGLSLRSGPSVNSDRIGGLDYNTKIIVLGTNNDGQWQRIRRDGGEQEGWIKSGNIEKMSN